MGKVLEFLGYSFIGLGIVGIVSYSAIAFPTAKSYGMALGFITFVALCVAIGTDDGGAKFFNIEYDLYISVIVVIAALVLIGSVIQWLY